MMLVQASPEFVTRVMRDPRVWHWVAEDGVSPESYICSPRAVCFAHQGRGFAMFKNCTRTMYEIHVAMLKGTTNVQPWVMECIAEMRRRGAKKFAAPIAEWNRAALRLARSCGFIEEGRISAALIRNGRPHALIFMGAC
ncbi:hypothetical protein WKR98_13270 [Pigmentiphaga sp. YJ18]|uniref:GNAT family N-acetyltransferase n=1 Tax=Pigmentiphaga sp. YJ18 TaxID=3134907 RepID=UPI0031172425